MSNMDSHNLTDGNPVVDGFTDQVIQAQYLQELALERGGRLSHARYFDVATRDLSEPCQLKLIDLGCHTGGASVHGLSQGKACQVPSELARLFDVSNAVFIAIA